MYTRFLKNWNVCFQKTARGGFTLTEMLTVVLIVGVLAAVAVPQYRRTIQRTRATEAVAMLKALADSSERLAIAFGKRTVAAVATSGKFTFERLDVINQDSISCSFPEDDTMTCDHFTYVLGGDGTIAATQPSTGVTLTIYPDKSSVDSDYITCAEEENGTYCDLYGYTNSNAQ